MTELIDAPRVLVPTDRQAALGDVIARPVVIDREATSAETEEPSRAAKARAHVSGLDPRTIRGSRTPLVVFVLLAVFAGVDDGVFQVVLPELRAEFGGNIGPLLIAGTTISIVTALAGPMFGFLVDRVSRVRLVRISQIGTNVVGLAAPLFAHSLLNVVMYRAGSGLLGGAQGAAPASLMADYYDVESASKVLTILPAATALGGILTPVAAGLSVDHFGGWRGAALILGIFATLISLPTLLLKEPERAQRQLESLGAHKTQYKPPTLKESFRTVSGIYTMRRIWAAMVFNGAAVFGLGNFLALYWAQVFGLTPTARGYITSVTNGAQFIVLLALAPLLSGLVSRRPGRVMLLFGLVVMSSGGLVLVLAYCRILPIAIVASIPLTAGTAVLSPALTILLLRLIPADVRGFGIGTIGPPMVLGQIVFTIVIQAFPASAPGLQHMALTFMPFFLAGGYLLVTASGTVERDIRAADAATVARMAAIDEESGPAALLVCRDVEVRYQGGIVVDHVDFDLQQGEMIALLGTNGAGKSTLLKVICGVVPASNGAVFFDGRNITKEPPHLNVAHGVVMVPGGRAVFPTLSVRENLRSATLADHDDGEPAMDLAEVFALFPVLETRLDQRAGDLSGGEQQMVALGQALLMRPKLLMIDELSLGLAPAVVDQLLEALQEINRRGTSVVIVEQSLNVALTVAERAVFMDKGRIVFDGRTDELLGRPDLVRSVFMGGAATGGARAVSRRVSLPEDELEAIRVEDLTVDFGGIRALDGVTLAVAPREVLGILGPNGAGKTTLFDAISGFVPTASGSVLVEAVDVSSTAPDERARAGLSRSFQDSRLFPSMTVRENIAVALERFASRNAVAAMAWSSSTRRSEDRIRRRVDGLLDLLSLGPLADKFVSELSTGSRRAVDVAVVMAAEPKVLLLDEPSSGLAQAEVEALGPVITRLARETGAAVLVIEHDLPLLSAVSHRMAAMERGRLLLVGDPNEVLTDSRVLSSYLNASERSLSRSGSRLSTIAAALGAAPAQQHTPEEEGS